MGLKKINRIVKSKPPKMPSKGYNTLNEAIKNTPRYKTREIAIIKAEDKYFAASKLRDKKRTIIDKKILERAYKYKKSKTVHTHITGFLKELPSSNDIPQLSLQYLKYNKKFTAIANIDRKTGEMSGYVAILFTKKTHNFIKQNFPKLIKSSKKYNELYSQLSDLIHKKMLQETIKAQEMANEQKNVNNKKFITTYNAEFKRVMFEYYENVLGLRFRFVPNTSAGYKFNKATMSFERI